MAIPPVEGTPGHAVPPYSRHAVTTHLPTWQSILGFIDRKPEIMGMLKSMYPRMMLHADIKELIARICQFAKVPESKTCFLYPTLINAQHQVDFSSRARRGEMQLTRQDMEIKVFDLDVRYYAVFFEMSNTPKTMPFWSNAGVGVSSRRAEESLKHLDSLREVPIDSTPPPGSETPATGILQRRLVKLLEHAPVGGERSVQLQPSDVYFFQSGMAAIYWTNHYLTESARSGTTVMYGYGFHSTPHTLEDFSKSWEIFGKGTEEDLEHLEQWLEAEQKADRQVQAIWAEFPANPRLTTPDLSRLRKLADSYDLLLIIDDTIGSFCNIDVMGTDGADIVITSLSKSFSGYADLLMGSATLNPLSRAYDELKTLFSELYSNDVSPADLEALEQNSRNYLERSQVLNSNAQAVVNFLHTKAADARSPVSVVMYPSVHPQKANYEARMRSKSADFTPGYGCLFSVQFEDVPTTIAFYDELGKYLHISPHLGAHKTLVLAYVKAIYGTDLSHAKKFCLDERDIRVSIGFEDEEKRLLEVFEAAVEAAERVKHSSNNRVQAPEIITSIS